MRNSVFYRTVYSENTDLGMWPKLVAIMKHIDLQLEKIRSESTDSQSERFLKKWRYVVALLLVSRIFGRYSFSSKDLAQFDLTQLRDELVAGIWQWVQRQANISSKKQFLTSSSVRALCERAASDFGIRDVEAVEPPLSYLQESPRPVHLTNQFLDVVDSSLPKQPWKPGVHIEIAKTLRCSKAKVQAAIQELIAAGRRNQQVNGVVFDKDGKVLAVDTERVRADTITNQ